MIKSMTGYGRAVEELHGRIITVEVKSVNHRYFDCTVKAARVYSFLEDAIKKAAQNCVSRGKLDVYLSIDDSRSDDVEVVFNEHIFEAYYRAMREMAERYSLRDDISVASLAVIQRCLQLRKGKRMRTSCGRMSFLSCRRPFWNLALCARGKARVCMMTFLPAVWKSAGW